MFRFLILSIFLISCSPSQEFLQSSAEELERLAEFKKLPLENKLTIDTTGEVGTPLILGITFVEKESKGLLKNRKVRFYHTNSEGEYYPTVANDESTAKLSGEAKTDSLGRIYLETILPGAYGDSEGMHIHTTFFGARPKAYDIHFDQYTSFMGRNFMEDHDQFFITRLSKMTNGSLLTFLTMEIKRPNGGQ